MKNTAKAFWNNVFFLFTCTDKERFIKLYFSFCLFFDDTINNYLMPFVDDDIELIHLHAYDFNDGFHYVQKE